MAIVQQYPLKTPKNSDLLVGTSIPDPNTNDDPKTSSFSVSSIGSFLITQNNIITGGGTLNTIPMFTPDGQKIGNSIITQNALGTTIAVNGIFTVDSALTVTNGGDTNVVGDLEVDSSLTVSSSAYMNGALTVEGASAFNDEAVFWDQTVFNLDANFQSSISDATLSTGTAGQVLSSTGTEVRWIDNFVLTSPGGTDYRIVVDDAGVLSTVAV
jgi:hypothetical protein